MIGKMIIEGKEKNILSFQASYSRTTCERGYPDSLPIAHFLKVSFLTEEDDDFFADWMYGKNKYYKGYKGQWYNGAIIFYNENSYEQEFLHYELNSALVTNFRVDYEQEFGMITTLEIFVRERIYDHKFIINSEYYAIIFDYVKTKEKVQTINLSPYISNMYYTDLEGNIIKKGKKGHYLNLVIEGENLSGEKISLNLSDPEKDFEYREKHLTNDTLEEYVFLNNTYERIKLKIVNQKNK